jgi:hypothetical protein
MQYRAKREDLLPAAQSTEPTTGAACAVTCVPPPREGEKIEVANKLPDVPNTWRERPWRSPETS